MPCSGWPRQRKGCGWAPSVGAGAPANSKKKRAHHFLLGVVEIVRVPIYPKTKYAPDRRVQGWTLEKPDEAGARPAPEQGCGAIIEDEDRVIFKLCLNPSEACSDPVQLDCFM